jgi:hypothetical protein
MASQFPSASSVPTYLEVPSLYASDHNQSDVLRSLFPQPAVGLVGAHSSVSGFPTDAPVYRSMQLMESSALSPAPFDLHAAGLDQPSFEKNANKAFVPLQQPHEAFSRKSMELPPRHESPIPAQEPTVIVTSVVSSDQQQQQQQPLVSPPGMPMWLEPQSHFFCTCVPPTTPRLLFETVQSTLQTLTESEGNGSASAASAAAQKSTFTLDLVPSSDRFKIDCTAYQACSGAATPFIVRIYTSDVQHGKFCVEFQRRQGDVIHFYELFRAARARIQAAHPLAAEAPGRLEHSKSGDALSEGKAIVNAATAGKTKKLGLRSWSAPSLPANSAFGPSFSKVPHKNSALCCL